MRWPPKLSKKQTKNMIMIAGVLLAAFFVLLEWFMSRGPVVTPPPIEQLPTSTPIVDSSSTIPTSTATSTPIIVTTTTKPTSTPTSTITPPPPPPKPTIVGHAFGVSMGGNLSKMNPSALNQALNEISAMGATWVRFDIEWGNVQYDSPNKSTWDKYDTVVAALAAHHLHGLGIISYTPQWARTSTCTNGIECPPADPATFATFAAQVAARYKSYGMHDWEIWNEPNNYSFWAPKTDCAAYTNLLKAVYPAMKAADSQALIITGGMAPESTDNVNTSPIDFLSCIYKNGGEAYFDAVGDHPYTFPEVPSADGLGAWNQMSQTSPSLRSIMIANGDTSKKIWMTEFGAPTNGPDSNWYISEAQQAAMAKDTYNLYESYSWGGPLFWYTLQDSGTTTDTNENFFGLLHFDGSVKPAYTTIQSLLTQ